MRRPATVCRPATIRPTAPNPSNSHKRAETQLVIGWLLAVGAPDGRERLGGERLTAIAMVMMVIGYLVWPLVQ